MFSVKKTFAEVLDGSTTINFVENCFAENVRNINSPLSATTFLFF